MDTLEQFLATAQPGWHIWTLHLRDAYFHLHIAQPFRRFLCFHWLDQVYQFTVLPCGLRSSPFIFTKLMRLVMTHVRTICQLHRRLCLRRTTRAQLTSPNCHSESPRAIRSTHRPREIYYSSLRCTRSRLNHRHCQQQDSASARQASLYTFSNPSRAAVSLSRLRFPPRETHVRSQGHPHHPRIFDQYVHLVQQPLHLWISILNVIP